MKKLPALLMSGFLVLSLASCQSPSQNPAEAYKAACEKTPTLTATDYDATIAAQVEASGMSMNIDMDIGMKLDMKDKQNPKMALDLSTSLFGQSVEGSLVCTDGTCYISSMGEKSKFAYTAEDLTSVGLDKGIWIVRLVSSPKEQKLPRNKKTVIRFIVLKYPAKNWQPAARS